MVEKVQRHAFRRHHQPGRAADRRHDAACHDSIAIGQLGLECDPVTHQPECSGGKIQPGDNAGLAGREAGRGPGFWPQRRLAGQIAGQAQVFLQCGRDGAVDKQARQLGRQAVGTRHWRGASKTWP
ncbi:hypothetical protein D9M68_888380 [compost metagenome]